MSVARKNIQTVAARVKSNGDNFELLNEALIDIERLEERAEALERNVYNYAAETSKVANERDRLKDQLAEVTGERDGLNQLSKMLQDSLAASNDNTSHWAEEASRLAEELDRHKTAAGDLMNATAEMVKERRDLERNLGDAYEDVARLTEELDRLRMERRQLRKLYNGEFASNSERASEVKRLRAQLLTCGEEWQREAERANDEAERLRREKLSCHGYGCQHICEECGK